MGFFPKILPKLFTSFFKSLIKVFTYLIKMFSFASLIFNLIFLKVFDILNIYSIKLKIKNVCIVKIPHLPIHTQTLTCILTHIEICKPQAYMLCLHSHLHASAHLRAHKMIGPIISFAEICNWWWETFRKIVNKRFEKKKQCNEQIELEP